MSNPIKDIEDVDDDLFISKKPQNYIFADKKASDINEKTNRMLMNSRNAVQESESIGRSALEMLSSQRETLERVEDDLDNINSMTRATQKHLNNMRSFFGGIKSLFSNSSNSSATNNLPAISNNKPGLPRSATMASVPSSSSAVKSSSPEPTTRHRSGQFQSAPLPNQPPEDEFEANLSEIGYGLGRLKEMATKLGDEITDHNDMLDRITEKSERAGDSVKLQNRQIQQLLKKG